MGSGGTDARRLEDSGVPVQGRAPPARIGLLGWQQSVVAPAPHPGRVHHHVLEGGALFLGDLLQFLADFAGLEDLGGAARR